MERQTFRWWEPDARPGAAQFSTFLAPMKLPSCVEIEKNFSYKFEYYDGKGCKRQSARPTGSSLFSIEVIENME